MEPTCTSMARGGLARRARPGGPGYADLPDALGSVRQLADGSGAVVLAQSYKPYGEVLSSEGAGSTPYGYIGEWTDDTGLVFLRARYLDTGSGRFLTRDPWGGSVMRPGTFNGYSYVTNNPVRLVDPLGLCEVDPYDPYFDYDCWALAAGVAEMIGDTWENVGLHSDYEWLLDAYAELSSIPIHVSYDPYVSYLQGLRIGLEWLFEAGPEVRYFGPEDPLTIDLMYDIGLQWARQDYAAHGFPATHHYHFQIDDTGGKGGTFAALVRENLELLWCTANAYHLEFYYPMPEGNIDMIGAALGSYDVYFADLRNNWVEIRVENESTWASFTRYQDPFTGEEKYLVPYREREYRVWWMNDYWTGASEIHAQHKPGFGGEIEQVFIWTEPKYAR